MDVPEAREVILRLLHQQQRARNSEMLAALGGDNALLELVREDLIFEGVAEDVRGVGLQYVGPPETPEPLPAGDAPGTPQHTDAVPTPPAIDDAESFTYDVFLSFSTPDTELARDIFNELSGAGMGVFWSPVSLPRRAGRFWFEELGAALEQARHLVVLLSDAALESPWVKLEYMTFLDMAMRSDNRLLIPLVAEGLDLNRVPRMLRQLQMHSLGDEGGARAVVAVLTGAEAAPVAGQMAEATALSEAPPDGTPWYEETFSKDSRGQPRVGMKCRTCSVTLGSYTGPYAPADFCPNCRARSLGLSVDSMDALRRPQNPRLPLYDLCIAGVEPFARRSFSNEPLEPGPPYMKYEKGVQEIMVRLQAGETPDAIREDLERVEGEGKLWRIPETIRDAQALLDLGVAPFPELEEKSSPGGAQMYGDRHSRDAWYRVHRIDLYDDQWECAACGRRGPTYARGTHRPPDACPSCGHTSGARE